MRLVKMPRLGQDMEEGVIVEWLKLVGDEVQEGELLAVIETDKAEVAFESPTGGFLVAVLMEPGSTVATGGPIAWIADDPSAQPPPPESRISVDPVAPEGQAIAPPPQETPPPPPRRSRRKPASPLARRRAAELGVDLSEVEGTGPGGRVTEDDILRDHQRAQAQAAESGELSRMRQAIAVRMSKSAAVPQFQLMREIVLETLEDTGEGPRVTYTDLLLWATSQALEQNPGVNSSWVEGDPPAVRGHPEVNLGFAVAVDDGLIVPVIRDASALTLGQIAVERRRLEAAVRKGGLRSDDLEGATFTVSNLGGAGVDEFTALINPPEAGILAVGAVRPRPIVSDGALVAAPTVRLTLTGDHRVFDGMEGARFLASIVERLQSLYNSTATSQTTEKRGPYEPL